MNKFLLILRFVFIVILSFFVQSSVLCSENDNYKALIEKANEAMQHYDYKGAVIYYQKASLNIKKIQRRHLELFRQMGYAQMQLKEYKSAVSSFEKYIRICETQRHDETELQSVQAWKEVCEAQISESEKERIGKLSRDQHMQIVPLKHINTPGDELGIVWMDDQGVFLYSSDFVLTNSFSGTSSGDFNIYQAQWDAESMEVIKKGALKINSKDQEIASSVSPEENLLYFTIYEGNNTKGNLYYWEYNNEKWIAPRLMDGHVNTPYSEENPCISADGRILFFSSDRPGGFGGKDLYYTIKMGDGSWSEARNMGAHINSKGDENTPFIDTDNTLYFSSDGHDSYGKMDIFRSRACDDGSWSEPENLGQPYNSPENDIFYRKSPCGRLHLFSSSRERPDYDMFMIRDTRVEQRTLATNTANQELSSSLSLIRKDLGRMEDMLDEIREMSGRLKTGAIDEKQSETLHQKGTEKAEKEDEIISVQSLLACSGDDLLPGDEELFLGFDLEDENCPVYFTEIKALRYSVQIGAYYNPLGLDDPFFTTLDRKNINIEKEEGFFKYTIGDFPTIHHATAYKNQLRKNSYHDAFITCYYLKKRIPVKQALTLIIDQLRGQYSLN
jgi:hypothetical protein